MISVMQEREQLSLAIKDNLKSVTINKCMLWFPKCLKNTKYSKSSSAIDTIPKHPDFTAKLKRCLCFQKIGWFNVVFLVYYYLSIYTRYPYIYHIYRHFEKNV